MRTYSVTDLGSTTVGYGINATAQIAGRLWTGRTVPGQHCPPRHPNCRVSVAHAFRYSAGQITDIGTLGGTFSDARAINNNGDVAGSSTLCGTDMPPFVPEDAFLFSNGHMKDLGTLGGGSSRGLGVNRFGEVVGDSYTASLQDHAFLYSNGNMTDLGTLGSSPSAANGINDSHQVVGSSEVDASRMHAFMWANGNMKDIGTLGGSQSIAYAINNAGQVVGYASPPNGSVHAFLYTGGSMTDLGAFYDSSVGEAINNLGVVVGESDGHAFIYSGGTLRDLNNLVPAGSGFVLTEATGINDAGQIVCSGSNSFRQAHTFLLNPT